jgi:hypothetical protein
LPDSRSSRRAHLTAASLIDNHLDDLGPAIPNRHEARAPGRHVVLNDERQEGILADDPVLWIADNLPTLGLDGETLGSPGFI